MQYRRMIVIVTVIFAMYVGSYLVLSRAGLSRGRRDCLGGFDYVEVTGSRTSVLNRVLIGFYYPLWCIDCWLGTGRPLACDPMFELSGGGSDSIEDGPLLRVSGVRAQFDKLPGDDRDFEGWIATSQA